MMSYNATPNYGLRGDPTLFSRNTARITGQGTLWATQRTSPIRGELYSQHISSRQNMMIPHLNVGMNTVGRLQSLPVNQSILSNRRLGHALDAIDSLMSTRPPSGLQINPRIKGILKVRLD